jgi:hypothetical protein
VRATVDVCSFCSGGFWEVQVKTRITGKARNSSVRAFPSEYLKSERPTGRCASLIGGPDSRHNDRQSTRESGHHLTARNRDSTAR